MSKWGWIVALRSLRRDRRGVAALEFALVAPLLFYMIFAIIRLGMAEWTQTILYDVAQESARCLALGTNGSNCLGVTTTCTTIPCYALSVASSRGLSTNSGSSSLQTANVTASSGGTNTCQGNGSGIFYAVSVSIPAYPLYVPAVLLTGNLSISTTLNMQATACYPGQSSATTPQ